MNEKELNRARGIAKKALIVSSAISVILILVYSFLFIKNQNREKIIIDGSEIRSKGKIFYNKEGTKYVDLNRLFNTLGMYKINSGVYGSTNASKDDFYIETPYEAVQFTSGTKNMSKSIIFQNQDREVDLKTGEIKLTEEEIKKGAKKPEPREKTPIDNAIIATEDFKLKNKIIKENAKVYASFEDLKYILNMKVNVSKNQANLYLTTIPTLEKKIARHLKDNSLALSALYQNRKAIIDDYFIALNSNNFTGVYKRYTDSNMIENIVGPQYEEIRFIQSDENIYFTTQDKKLGLKSLKTSNDIIKAGDYDAINIYYKEDGLYIAKKNNKFGIVNNSGKLIVPIEYNQIGLIENKEEKLKAAKKDDAEKEKQIDKDSKVIMDKFIPVMQTTVSKGDVWRLVLKDGSAATDLNYVNIGYKVPTYVKPNQRNEIEIPEEKKELARELKITKYSIPEENIIDLKRLGITTNRANIIDGAQDLLYIPDGYQDSGVVVEVYDPTEKRNTSRYGIVRADFNKDNQNDPFVYPAVAERIYKIDKDNETKYFAEIGNMQEEFVKGSEGRIRRMVEREDVNLIDLDEERKRMKEAEKEDELKNETKDNTLNLDDEKTLNDSQEENKRKTEFEN